MPVSCGENILNDLQILWIYCNIYNVLFYYTHYQNT